MKNGNATVFIVDDDASARTGMGRLMRAAGYDVKLFDDALAFLDVVCETSHGCVILDIQLQGMSGISLQEELASRNIFMPVIIVTADENLDRRRQARQSGAVAFFRKPVDGSALLDAISWAISKCDL